MALNSLILSYMFRGGVSGGGCLFYLLLILLLTMYFLYNTPENFKTAREKSNQISQWIQENPDKKYKHFKREFDDVNIIDYEKYKYNTL